MGRSAHETSEVQSNFEEKIVAQEIAASAYNSGVSEVRRDFENWRQVVIDQPYQGGHYNLSLSGPPEGPIEVVVEGYFGDAMHRISGQIVLSLGDFIDAFTFDSKAVSFNPIGGNFMISGVDRLPPSAGGGDGYGPDGHGVRTLEDVVYDAAVASLPAAQVHGVDGGGDIVDGEPLHVVLEDLYAEASGYAGGNFYVGDTTFTGGTFGSALNPTVIKVYGDLTLQGSLVGYGVLYVDGDLSMSGSARWEGLVLLDDAARSLSIKGSASIYGGIVARGGLFGDPGLSGGHFDVDVFDRPTKDEVYHEHEYDDKYDVSYVDLLSSGCGKQDDGALCWDQIIGNNYQELRIELFNPGSSDGVFALTADGTRHTGASQGGLTLTVDPSTVTEFAINFSTLQAMAQTEPKNVQNDIPNRDGAFSVRIYN
ncbi:MAG: hypothetical protein ACE10K_05155, partial [Rhodothermales bacterium]